MDFSFLPNKFQMGCFNKVSMVDKIKLIQLINFSIMELGTENECPDICLIVPEIGTRGKTGPNLGLQLSAGRLMQER